MVVTMNGLNNYERRYSIANDEISLGMEDFDSSSVSESTSVGSINSAPILPKAPAKLISNDNQSRSQLPSLPLLNRWRIEDKDVSEIPEIYPRISYPLILRNREVSEIGDRLWTFFRTHDIRSAYDRKQGRLLCCTEKVGFVVQFWRRRSSDNHTTSNNESNEEIILEIQRRKGCSWAMQKIRSALKKSILQQHQFSQSEPNLRLPRISPTMKRSFFPPPPKRLSSRNEVVTIKPLLMSSGFKPLSLSSLTAVRDPSSSSLPPPLRKSFCAPTSTITTHRF